MKVRAPGRICLFGEHQDYLGYPIIAAAIDKYIFIKDEKTEDPMFQILMPDIGKEVKIPIHTQTDLDYDEKRDYLKSCYNILKRLGFQWGKESGYKLTLSGNIPINAGASSSSAMVIAWLSYLTLRAGKKIDPVEIGKLGYEGEVAEFGEAGGMMDHYASALGGLIYMDTEPKFLPQKIQNFSANFSNSFILVDSEQKKNTVDDLKKVKERALRGFSRIKELYPTFNKYTTQISDIEPFLQKIDENIREVLVGNLNNRDLTLKAFDLLKNSEKQTLTLQDKKIFGTLISKHHENLSKRVGISTKKIDEIINFCLKNGAYGAKINGSGFGGTIVVYCPENRDKINQTLQNKGYKTYPIEISEGTGEF